jgi:hypothetical protein
MSYTLDALKDDIRRELSHGSAKEAVCRHVARALTDREFVATHLKDRPKGSDPREILYEDSDLGFCICAHVYDGKAIGSPHDHGSSWAIYGLAVGDTEMTDWRIVRKGDATNPSLVEPENVYVLKPGDAHFYDVGVVHSPKRDGLTKLVRIEGANLDRIKRSNIKAAERVGV